MTSEAMSPLRASVTVNGRAFKGATRRGSGSRSRAHFVCQ
jgi:hypothetical protein